MILTIIILSILLILSIIINIRQNSILNKIELLFDNQTQDLNQFIIKISEVYIKALSKLERIDKKGAFASDDEVGFVFNILKNTIVDLAKFNETLLDSIKNENDSE